MDPITGIIGGIILFVAVVIAPPPNPDNNAVGNYVTLGLAQPDCSNIAPDFRLAGCNGIPLGDPYVSDQKHDKGDAESEQGPA